MVNKQNFNKNSGLSIPLSINNFLIFLRIATLFFIIIFMFPMAIHAFEDDFIDLDIEELMDLTVTSVNKKTQQLSDSATAITVITNEDLIRSGATNIPDALRTVPGVNVARIDSNKWAVSIRGFNSRFASKLLVLIDGRSIYTPMFSGVYWESNDLLLKDVERIEIIRGPGATLWGANAVNGVINIITKHSKDTCGGYFSAATGSIEKHVVSARYGDSIGEKTFWRLYLKSKSLNEFEYKEGKDASDDWKTVQGGFRADIDLTENDNLTIQGDIHKGDINQNFYKVDVKNHPFMSRSPADTSVTYANILTNWKHEISSTSDLALKACFDLSEREEDIIDEERKTYDLDFQHSFSLGSSNEVLWGVRYRYMSDEYKNSDISTISPNNKDEKFYSGFIQDEIKFMDERIHLTLGSKIEHNDYTGNEIQPSLRCLFKINKGNKIWFAVSRAVRTPSRGEADGSFNYFARPVKIPPSPFEVPMVIKVVDNEDFESEELLAYEAGYRFIPAKKLSVDLSVFYNKYENLRAFEQGRLIPGQTSVIQEIKLVNSQDFNAYGLETDIIIQPIKFLRTKLEYSYLNTDDCKTSGFYKHKFSLNNHFAISENKELDLTFRYTDETKAYYFASADSYYHVDDYFTMDLRFAWDMTPELKLSLVGRNLLDHDGVEYVQETFNTDVKTERSLLCKIEYRF